MADKEKVLFSRGPRATMPSDKVPGPIYITTDTGEMFVDDTDTSRIQVGPSPADVRSLGVSGASVGQVPTVKAVDESGVPTEWEATDKMDKANPTGTGSFSLNRKSGTTVGTNSHTEGYNPTASGTSSHAEGNGTTASGNNGSHAEGNKTFATGKGSHAEGNGTTASGDHSHAEGVSTTASGDSGSHSEGYHTTASNTSSHAEGFITTASGYHSHAEGNGTKAASADQHAQGKYNIEDAAGTYADIIGNGTNNTKRSNAATTDWAGNAWYAGDVYVGSTSGTNKDAGSKKLATEEYVDSAVSGGLPLGLTGATVGQTVKIKTVDETGVPTEWEAVDAVSGDSKPFVVTVTYGDNGALTADKTHAEIVAAYANGAQINAKIVNYPGVNAPSILPLYVNMSDEMFMFSGSGVVDGSAMAMTATDTNGSWRVELAELAKLTDIPTSLKNPESLTFTGAVSGSYDGSSAMTVNIPSSVEITGGTTDLTAGVSELASGALYIVYE